MCFCCGCCQARNFGYPEATRCAQLPQWSQMDLRLEYSTWVSPCKEWSFLGWGTTPEPRCDSNCIYVSALSRVSEMGAEVLPKQENLSVLYTVGSKALQYQANMKMVLNKKNQITLFATSVSNLQFRQWSHICQSNLLLLKQHSLTYTHDMFGLFSSIFLYLIFFSPLFFFPLQLSVSISMQVASLELVLLLLSCVLSAKDKNHMSETRTTSVRPAATNPSMILMGPSGKLSVLNLHWVHLWGKRTSEERKGRWHVNGMSFVFLQVLEGWSSRRCIFRSSGNYGSHRYS